MTRRAAGGVGRMPQDKRGVMRRERRVDCFSAGNPARRQTREGAGHSQELHDRQKGKTHQSARSSRPPIRGWPQRASRAIYRAWDRKGGRTAAARQKTRAPTSGPCRRQGSNPQAGGRAKRRADASAVGARLEPAGEQSIKFVGHGYRTQNYL
jgi:hypothetical protein